MGNHRHEDRFPNGAPEPDDDAARDAAGPEDGGFDAGGRETDHFGLFDDHGGGDAAGPATGEVDLGHLRDVLAGRGDEPAASAADVHRRSARRPKRRHRVRSTVIAVIVLVLIAGGVTAGVVWWQRGTASVKDFATVGSHTLVVRVNAGDGLYDVGQTLASKGVIADVATFVADATADGRLKSLQPGYYRVHEHSPAATAIADLANPDNRLGQMRIVPGDTLADVTKVSTTGATSTRPGIYSKMAAACVPTDEQAHCFTAADLAAVGSSAALGDLGVVGWAAEAAAKAPDAARRLEGLILPGDYSIAPGSTASEALRDVVSASAAQWNTTDIVASAKAEGRTPYQLAIVASLVQAEAGDDQPADQAKVARVIDNRLRDGMKLQFDSTVNYGLGRASISTTDTERLDPTNAYSTYAHAGLTPTPIGAPGPSALSAAEDPAAGDWLYFVAVDLDGHSCFSVTPAEHDECVAKARANGVFG